MEWRLGLTALAVLGVVFPWSFILSVIGLLYTAWYCVYCAAKAELGTFEDAPSSLSQNLRWRATIAWLHFLVPIARDWGRLKGGLTPWRSATTPQAGTNMSLGGDRLYP